MGDQTSAPTVPAAAGNGVAPGGGDALPHADRIPSAGKVGASRGCKRELTPDDVDHSKCLARILGSGLGGQCKSRPQDGRDLCRKHVRSPWHGLVAGDVPPAKLPAFRKAKARLEAGAHTDGQKKQKGGAKKLLYARHLMWHEATKLDIPDRRLDRDALTSIDTLEEDEFNRCLQRVHVYVSMNPGQQKYIEKEKGPKNFGDFKLNAGLAAYNGTGGGRVYRWHTRPVFERYLRTLCPLWSGPPQQRGVQWRPGGSFH